MGSNDYNNSYAAANGNVTDSVFMLSYTDVLDGSYGFSSATGTNDAARVAQGTDYAECQGLSVNDNGASYWWTRSVGTNYYRLCYVGNNGDVRNGGNSNDTFIGVRPAVTLNLESPTLGCALGVHMEDGGTVTTAPTCYDDGVKTYTCVVCGAVRTESMRYLGHDFETEVVELTCTSDGYTSYTCRRCGYEYRENEETATGHNYTAVVTPNTCTEDGYTTYTCENCGDTYTADITEATGHDFKNNVCLNCGKVLLAAGEVYEIGSYPQTKVTDEALIAALDGISAEWSTFDYYYDNTSACRTMQYKDVEYNGEKYRGERCAEPLSGYQTENGYFVNTTYWFKYEPIEWKVLDPDTGLFLSEKIINGRKFYRDGYSNEIIRDGEYCSSNSYKHSDVRAFLTDVFYDMAFTNEEKTAIVPVTINGNDRTDVYRIGNGDVTDSVFLLSPNDVENAAYGFNSQNDRLALATDYAKYYGTRVYRWGDEYSGYSAWWLRSAGERFYDAYEVFYNGNVSRNGIVNSSEYGVRPAVRLDVNSPETYCAITGGHETEDLYKAPTCTEDGYSGSYCPKCGGQKTLAVLPALGHNFENGRCTNCGTVEFKDGDTFTFGSYPQSEVTDETLIDSLDGIEAEWISYGYYFNSEYSDFMQYKDVEYNGEKYRAVTFNQFRPYYAVTPEGGNPEYSNQDENGYYVFNVYWFKYEPLEWTVLDADEGLVTCKNVIDSQPLYNGVYSGPEYRDGEDCYMNSYNHSAIRSFLTETFYDVAFSDTEKSAILTATVDGNDYTDAYEEGNGEVTDSVFLLSYGDLVNEDYGFIADGSWEDDARRASGTDYAKCQNLYVLDDADAPEKCGNARWWLRSAGENEYSFAIVDFYGDVTFEYGYSNEIGVRPALKLDFDDPESSCAVAGHKPGERLFSPVSCESDGYEGYACEYCGASIITTVYPSTGHKYENRFCTVCGFEEPALIENEILEIGSYPQSEVTDAGLTSALNGISAEWISYDYYYAAGETSEAMKYKDVEYNGEKYRAVTFSAYRPYYTNFDEPTGIYESDQADNCYYTDEVYWFKYEPLKWRVLDPDTGLLLCESVIDAQQFYRDYYEGMEERDGEECYANSYKHSDIRAFLTDDFFNLAFTADEKDLLVPEIIDGNDYSADWCDGNDEVEDFVFLPADFDMLNEGYGFSYMDDARDAARCAYSTDYAKCQGVYVSGPIGNPDGWSYWYLRSAGDEDGYVCGVETDGAIHASFDTYYSDAGVRPAIKLDVENESLGCDLKGHAEDEGTVTTPPTCTAEGVKTYRCADCGEVLRTETVEPLGHEYENGVCTRCGANESDVVPGDVNLDGKVNSTDVNLLLKFISGVAEPANETASLNADMNGDGKVSAADVNLIIRSISGL